MLKPNINYTRTCRPEIFLNLVGFEGLVIETTTNARLSILKIRIPALKRVIDIKLEIKLKQAASTKVLLRLII